MRVKNFGCHAHVLVGMGLERGEEIPGCHAHVLWAWHPAFSSSGLRSLAHVLVGMLL
jgi:hypothetical protein